MENRRRRLRRPILNKLLPKHEAHMAKNLFGRPPAPPPAQNSREPRRDAITFRVVTEEVRDNRGSYFVIRDIEPNNKQEHSRFEAKLRRVISGDR